MKDYAICFSGLYRGQALKNIEIFRQAFPNVDMYFEAWEHPDLPDFITPVKEPREVFPSYGFKASTQRYVVDPTGQTCLGATGGWHCKQHYGHAHIVKSLPEDYKYIVRARYDVRLSLDIDWTHMARFGMKHKLVIGIGVKPPLKIEGDIKTRNPTWDILVHFPYYGWGQDHWPYYGHALSDSMVMHPRSMLDCDFVFRNYEDETLRKSEHGWWQILIENNYGPIPYDKDPSVNYIGGLVFDRWLD